MTKRANKYIVIGAVVLLLTVVTIKQVSAAENIIKEFEGGYLDAYLDPVGIPTIGYGSIFNYDEKRPVKIGDRVTKDTALRFLREETKKIIPQIKKAIKVPITQNELDALTSFVYNVGIGAFLKSTLLKRLNAGEPKTAVADEFLKWNKATKNGVLIELPGLTRRRIAEKNLFLGK